MFEERGEDIEYWGKDMLASFWVSVSPFKGRPLFFISGDWRGTCRF